MNPPGRPDIRIVERRAISLLAYLLLIAGSVLMLAPVAWTVSTSLKEEGLTQTLPPTWIPATILRIFHEGRDFQVMSDRRTGEYYLLLDKDGGGYTLRKIESELDISWWRLLRESRDLPLKEINARTGEGKSFLVAQEYDVKSMDEFEMVTKQRILTGMTLDDFRLGEKITLKADRLEFRKVVWFRWRNYLEAWNTIPFGRMYANSILVSLGVTFGVLLTSSLAAYSFARIPFPGREKLFLLYLGTMMVPFPVTLIPTFVIIREIGWLDSLAALIVPGIFSAYGVFFLRQFFRTIPRELEEAAVMDGCSRFGIYWRIMLPLSKPALATLGTFTFIGVYNDFLGPLIYLKSESNMTLPVGLSYFQTQYGSQWALLMSASMIILAPMIMVYLFNQKFFVKGIVMTGLKE